MRKSWALSLLMAVLAALVICGALLANESKNNASAIEVSANIGVYWDTSCSRRVTSVSWGLLAPGNSRNVAVYVRSEGNEHLYLRVRTANWNPAGASTNLTFSWGSAGKLILANTTLRVTQTLRVSPSTLGLTNFSFDIVFEENGTIPGDVNRDAYVGIDDILTIRQHFGSSRGSANFLSTCDIDEDDYVGISDMFIAATDYGREHV